MVLAFIYIEKMNNFTKIGKEYDADTTITPRNTTKFCWGALVTPYQPRFPFCDSYIK